MKHRGISLLEIVIAIGIVIILLAVGVPVFVRHELVQRVNTETDKLASAINLVKSGRISELIDPNTVTAANLVGLTNGGTSSLGNGNGSIQGNGNGGFPGNGNGGGANGNGNGGGANGNGNGGGANGNGNGGGANGNGNGGGGTSGPIGGVGSKSAYLLEQVSLGAASLGGVRSLPDDVRIDVVNGIGLTNVPDNCGAVVVQTSTGGQQAVVFLPSGQLAPGHTLDVVITLSGSGVPVKTLTVGRSGSLAEQ